MQAIRVTIRRDLNGNRRVTASHAGKSARISRQCGSQCNEDAARCAAHDLLVKLEWLNEASHGRFWSMAQWDDSTWFVTAFDCRDKGTRISGPAYGPLN